MQKRVFRLSALSALCAVLLCVCAAGGVMYTFVKDQTQSQLKEEIVYVAAVMNRETDKTACLAALHASVPGMRLTWVDAEGGVLFDSAVREEEMENHLERPEIQAAMEGAVGVSVRRSVSWERVTFYAAVRLEEGTIIRAARSRQSMIDMMMRLIPWFLAGIAPVILLVFAVTGRITRRFVAPINAVSLDSPLDNDLDYPELTPLFLRIDKQNKLIADQIRELVTEKGKLEAITESMREAMVMLDKDGRVVSINSAALVLFAKTKEDAIGAHILGVSRLASVSKAAEKALSGETEEIVSEINGRAYLLMASPVQGLGAVFILMDVTEKQNAEERRRAFTANVSHELKTPLTVISGYAEIMENGVAKTEDMRAFAGRIHHEAQRLLGLINDIIRLSRLDEGIDVGGTEAVNIWEVVKGVAARLSGSAEEKGIKLILTGSDCAIRGIPYVMDEIAYNLLDNAIRYNHPNGRVECDVLQSAGHVSLIVSDTGIGVPPEDRERVFERFYRVDDSHSKETGGTGLGLSIVKHGVMMHGGTVTLTARNGGGTTIHAAFPLEAEES